MKKRFRAGDLTVYQRDNIRIIFEVLKTQETFDHCGNPVRRVYYVPGSAIINNMSNATWISANPVNPYYAEDTLREPTVEECYAWAGMPTV